MQYTHIYKYSRTSNNGHCRGNSNFVRYRRCTLVGVRQVTYPVWYGGDSGNRIFVLYWRCPLIRVSVIRGSTVYVYIRVRATKPFVGFS